MTGEGMLRAVRGAVTVSSDTEAEITEATREMLDEIVRRNAIDQSDLVNALFTVTPDLHSAFPALAARQLGWLDVPLLCATEIAVPGALPRCVRVMVQFYTSRARGAVRHVYLRDARTLRPDLVDD